MIGLEKVVSIMKAHYKSVWSVCLDNGMGVDNLRLVELLGGTNVRDYDYAQFTEALTEASQKEEIEEEKRKMFGDLATLINGYFERKE